MLNLRLWLGETILNCHNREIFRRIDSALVRSSLYILIAFHQITPLVFNSIFVLIGNESIAIAHLFWNCGAVEEHGTGLILTHQTISMRPMCRSFNDKESTVHGFELER